MKKRQHIVQAVLSAALALFVSQGVAETTDAADPQALVLLSTLQYTAMSYPSGVRNIGMGSTGTADIGGFPTGFFNPASFAWADAVTFESSFQDWILGVEFLNARITGGSRSRRQDSVSNWRYGGSLGYSSMTVEPAETRTIILPEGTVRIRELDDYYMSGSGALAWEKEYFSIGVGGTVKYMRETLGDEHLSAWAFDVGVLTALSVIWNDLVRLRPRVGVAVTNLSDGISVGDGQRADIVGEQRWAIGLDVSSPLLSVGSGVWRRDVSILAFSVNYDKITRINYRFNKTDFLINGSRWGGDENRWAFGCEASILGLLQARYGENNDTFGYQVETRTLGLGVGWDFGGLLFQFDFARVTAETSILESLEDNAFGVIVGGRF
jgi:hypothetical protein